MISFKEFLTEGRSEELSTEQLISILKKNCKEFLSLRRYPMIYRGVKGNTNSKLVKPSEFTRKSKSDADGNVYTVLMDSLDSWKDYPKRSKSIICSNVFFSAGNYGKARLVIPFDGAKWGVCDGDDIFYSFDGMTGDLSVDPEGLGPAIYSIHKLLKKYKSTSIYNGKDVQYPNDYKILLTFLKELDDFILKYIVLTETSPKNLSPKEKEMLSGLEDDIGTSGDLLIELIKLRRKRKVNIGQILNDVMGPKSNDFKLLTTPQLTSVHNDDREIWTDSNAILICGEYQNYEKVLKEIYRTLNIKKSIDIDGTDEDDESAIFLKLLSEAIL